jgi:hypothetical protein
MENSRRSQFPRLPGTGLPVSCGMDSILVFVDRMTKMTHFIPCIKTTDAPEFAKLFVSHVVRLHGLPNTLTSDRGSIFTSHFWSTLSSTLGIDARKSMSVHPTSFHPQTDGQTEHVNQTLESYLRIFCNYDFDLLPLAEFAYNNATQESTKISPFDANYSLNPRFMSQFQAPSEHAAPAATDFAALNVSDSKLTDSCYPPCVTFMTYSTSHSSILLKLPR